MAEAEELKVSWVETEQNLADFFTKKLAKARFELLRDQLMGPQADQDHFLDGKTAVCVGEDDIVCNILFADEWDTPSLLFSIPPPSPNDVALDPDFSWAEFTAEMSDSDDIMAMMNTTDDGMIARLLAEDVCCRGATNWSQSKTQRIGDCAVS